MMTRRQLLVLGGLGLGGAGTVWMGGIGSEQRTLANPPASSGISQLPSTPGVVALEDFEFKTVKLSDTGKIIQPNTLQGKLFTQVIVGDINLKMVSIPAGIFTMGSPSDELQREKDEGPQHQVSIPAFFMAQTLITQAQWKAVAQLEKVKINLTAEPSSFEGLNRPVEQVSWDDATEFCARLSRETRLNYRLPSEAEWEYACRAKTTSTFSFGPTINPDVANYNGNVIYGKGSKGKYRQQTTGVGIFPANQFGLYDVHGNVWEWCQDWWHDSYDGAPNSGIAWVTDRKSGELYRVLRGGSWLIRPGSCRSASRGRNPPGNRRSFISFRVACSLVS
jgi:formylglycine-generating enzyme required for sulfatase activity